MILFFFFLNSLLAHHLHATELYSKKCTDIPMCAKHVTQITGQNYVFSGELKNKIQFAGDLEMTKNNAEQVFTNILYLEGFTRLPSGTPNTWQIVKLKDAKDLNLPLIKSDHQMPPELPNNWDLVTLSYKASYPDVLNELARICKNFMPPDAKVLVSELTGTLLLTDTSMNLKKMYQMIKDADRKPTPELKKKLQN